MPLPNVSTLDSEENGAAKSLVPKETVDTTSTQSNFTSQINQVIDVPLSKTDKKYLDQTIRQAQKVYKNNLELLIGVAVIAKTATTEVVEAIRELIEAKNIYEDDLEMFMWFVRVAQSHPASIQQNIRALVKAQRFYHGNKDKFKGFAKMVIAHEELGINHLSTAEIIYGQNIKIFNAFVEVGEQKGPLGIFLLAVGQEEYKTKGAKLDTSCLSSWLLQILRDPDVIYKIVSKGEKFCKE